MIRYIASNVEVGSREVSLPARDKDVHRSILLLNKIITINQEKKKEEKKVPKEELGKN